MIASKIKKSAAHGLQFPETGIILSPEEFRVLVNHERVRSNRFGNPFSMVVLDFILKEEVIFNELLIAIFHSIRSVDRVAWDKQGNISILLPDTDNEGARVFCEKCRGILGHYRHYFELNVYTYPDHWVANYLGGGLHQDFLSSESKAAMEAIFVYKMPIWKRTMDILISFLMILLLSPLLIFVGLYIKIISPGPIFFHQERIGYKGIPFQFHKFRSMKHGNDQDFHGKHSQNFIKDGNVPMDKLDGHDPRIIPGGKILRATCIDELPQLWNILKGDMSLVGPRPCIPYEAQEYLRWHTHRFDTMPGLTGLWQVSGKNKLTFKQMIRLDIAYCKKITFLNDVWIILKTPWAILVMLTESLSAKLRGTKPADVSETDD